MKLTIVAGARPNFMKIAPIIKEINRINKKQHKISFRLVHTGQHYDKNMSDSFFNQLNIPLPNVNLNCGSGSHAQITASIMIEFEKELIKNKPDLVIVVGDVTSTMACAITAQKLNIKVAHVEGGIRSRDWAMPEEINRLVTDSISNYFFTTSEIANTNLINEGIDKSRIFFVGNTMIDTLINNKNRLLKPVFFKSLNLKKKKYIVLTIHRPSNVDNPKKLEKIIKEIINSSEGLQIIFPIHPRTRKVFSKLKFKDKKLHIVDPMSYLEFNYLIKNSLVVITDSGGITEETTVLQIPCITLRDSTERPETVSQGTNELIGSNPKNIKPVMKKLFSGKWKQGRVPHLWDGNTSERIVSILLNLI